MCLLKVYLESERGRELIAQEVALISNKNGKIRLQGIDLKDIMVVDNADIKMIDTLSSSLILRKVIL